jgi:hypothetical protein
LFPSDSDSCTKLQDDNGDGTGHILRCEKCLELAVDAEGM